MPVDFDQFKTAKGWRYSTVWVEPTRVTAWRMRRNMTSETFSKWFKEYKDKYRGLAMFWKFDRAAGRIDVANSFAIELPPYWQDLCDSGKLVSEGWIFCNSLNTEMATGGVELGNPPFESGASQNDHDFLHVINWKKAEALSW